jgi:D-tagatose-1,6-bisphosphate aldolase subunit GatZ/KbaZ
MKNPMLEIIKRRAAGENIGIYSACTANELVLEAVMEAGLKHNTPVLVEATANQCNQFGGYTGMTPKDFMKFACNIAKKVGFPEENLILGGDHLGPLTWQNEIETEAMLKSDELIKQYVSAGFTKIHLDTSMRVADDDKNVRLSDEIIAGRTVRLAKIAEAAYKELQANDPESIQPVYIIGSEVPIPGGAQEAEDSVQVTSPDQFAATYETFKKAFADAGLTDAFDRVIGVVVQPGVEFGDDDIIEYDQKKSRDLVNKLKDYTPIVFEGHSTDYQTRFHLKKMVEDGIAILKVGPALTFYFREAAFALARIENELNLADSSNFITILDNEMIANPGDWQKYYHGAPDEQAYKRKYSFSDRCRYYFPAENVQSALSKLIENINNARVPFSILSQYLPTALTRLRESGEAITAENLLKARVKDCIDDYLFATIEK